MNYPVETMGDNVLLDVWDETNHQLRTGGGSGSAAVTIADGADVAEGAKADTAVTGDNSGSISAKLRGLNKVLADIWDSANHFLKIGRNQAAVVTLTIASSATTSGTYTAIGWAGFGLVMPSAFTGTSVSFLVSADNATFQPLYDSTSTLVSLSVAVSQSYDLPSALFSWPYWQIKSASSEGGSRSLVVVGKS
jgi:hypothetical protein